MRVLIIAHGHPEHSIGGAEHAAYHLFQGLRDIAGVEAFFLASASEPDRSEHAPKIETLAGRTQEFLFYGNNFDRFFLAQRTPSAVDALLSFVREIDPDVVHLHHYLTIGVELIGAVRHWKPNIRIIVTLHEYVAICHHYGSMVKTDGRTLCTVATDPDCAACFPAHGAAEFARRRIRLQHFFSQVDLFVAPSRFLRRRYVEWGMDPRRIVVRANPIAAGPAIQPADHREGARRIFGFFGQIHTLKGALELLTAFYILSQQPGDMAAAIRLVINGAYLDRNPPAYVARFRELLAKLRGRVEFAGPYAHGDLAARMTAVDWVVVPSLWWENSPLVVEEALANHRPVLCSGIGGMKEKVRPGKDGFHFPPGDPIALANLILRLAADERIWNRLQRTMRRPIGIADAVAAQLALYREPRHAPVSSP